MKATAAKADVSKENYGGDCLICGKTVAAFYGRWCNGGTCSKKCEEAAENKIAPLIMMVDRLKEERRKQGGEHAQVSHLSEGN